MAATPPHQILSSPQTPSTPLHAAAYERKPTRQSSRIRQRAAAHDSQLTPQHQTSPASATRSSTSPKASQRVPAPVNPQSPRSTPRKNTRRVHVISPSSPNTELSPPKPNKVSNSHLQPFLFSTTTISEGMLPTPIKTPKKKNVPTANAAARALFQDQSMESEIVAPSPRRGRKNKRFNGFSLESFRAEDGANGNIQIFTDNRDQVPKADTSNANPFIDRPQTEDLPRARRLAGGSKRRKISGEKTVDPQVQQAIEKDEGMVYVFRGKKVYRRFDDSLEDEEVIDDEDLGLLEHTEDGASRVKPLKTLTRKSIRPTRLFQTEQQKLTRDRAREEEALTDIEDDESGLAGGPAVDESNGKPRTNGIEKRNRASPFDSWPRVKAAGRHVSAPKGQKRSATEAMGDEESASSSAAPAAVTSNMKQKRTRA